MTNNIYKYRYVLYIENKRIIKSEEYFDTEQEAINSIPPEYIMRIIDAVWEQQGNKKYGALTWRMKKGNTIYYIQPKSIYNIQEEKDMLSLITGESSSL